MAFCREVFIPSAAYDAAPTHDIDILCMIGPMPGSAAEWEERGLHKCVTDTNRNEGGAAATRYLRLVVCSVARSS